MAEESADLAACDQRGSFSQPLEEPVRLWAMEEAKAATPGVGAAGDTSGCSALSVLMERLSLRSLGPVPGERKEGKGARRSGHSLMSSTLSPSQLISRASNSGVEYYWDQLNETVFTVHSSSRSSERPG